MKIESHVNTEFTSSIEIVFFPLSLSLPQRICFDSLRLNTVFLILALSYLRESTRIAFLDLYSYDSF